MRVGILSDAHGLVAAAKEDNRNRLKPQVAKVYVEAITLRHGRFFPVPRQAQNNDESCK